MSAAAQRVDVAVAGGGAAGLTLAAALKVGLGEGAVVTVIEPETPRPPDPRASAITAGNVRMLETLGLWGDLEAASEPINAMALRDGARETRVAPRLLSFEGGVTPGEPFARMVPNDGLLEAARRRAAALGVERIADRAVGSRDDGLFRMVRLASGGAVAARLLVAADGARSRLREEAGIPFHGWGYGQSAVTFVIAHSEPHRGIARQTFLPGGPLALLPMPGHRSSVVWTERTREAARLAALDPFSLADALDQRVGAVLGDIAVEGAAKAYPLSLGLAAAMAGPRLALVGDAAHVIHPIAGQGLNLGLGDAAALAERLVDALRLGLDPGAASVLAAYERDRRFAVTMMASVTDGINRLFSNDRPGLKLMRDAGLRLVDQIPALKRIAIGQASGLGSRSSRLTRGEPL